MNKNDKLENINYIYIKIRKTVMTIIGTKAMIKSTMKTNKKPKDNLNINSST